MSHDRLRFLILLIGTLAIVFLAGAQKKTAPETSDIRLGEPPPAPEQPIPYSHKLHVGMGLKCSECHTIPAPGFAAGYPPVAKCMTCHQAVKAESPHIQKLAEYAKKGEQVPWVKVYSVPEYVWFAHESHVKQAKIECEVCHGPVRESVVIRKEKSTSMGACMDCHAKYQAPNDCDFCHDPG